MNRLYIISILFLIIISCNNYKKTNISDELRGHTYDLILDNKKDTLKIEFKDSTFNIFENDERNLPWRISTFDNNIFLVLNNRVILIKDNEINSLNGILISDKDYSVELKKRKINWSKDLLNGIWIENKLYESSLNNNKLQIQPPPPPLSNSSEKHFQFHLHYEIKKTEIIKKHYYSVNKSNFEINNSNEFLTMKLQSDDNRTEEFWKIKELNDSIMIIDRTIEKNNSEKIIEKNIKLVKKTFANSGLVIWR